LAAPIAPLFVAWGSDEDRQAWLARGRRLTGASDTSLGEAEAQAVRDLGYQVTTGRATADRFERSVSEDDDPDGVVEVLRRMQETGPEPGLRAPIEELTDVTSLAAPVRDATGQVVLALHLGGFDGTENPQRLRACLDRLLAGAHRASELISA
jgi:hypothetical protein